MACTFSCTDLFKSSYFTNTFENNFTVFDMIKNSAHPSTSIATINMMLIFQLISTHMKILKTRFSGALTEALSTCWNAFCMLLTSVVIRVINPAEEKRSMLENENVWMFLYIASRRLQANPVEA